MLSLPQRSLLFFKILYREYCLVLQYLNASLLLRYCEWWLLLMFMNLVDPWPDLLFICILLSFSFNFVFVMRFKLFSMFFCRDLKESTKQSAFWENLRFHSEKHSYNLASKSFLCVVYSYFESFALKLPIDVDQDPVAQKLVTFHWQLTCSSCCINVRV